jgi:hypothetical protein
MAPKVFILNIDELIELLDDLREHFDQQSDINWEGGPNEAMQFLTRLDEIRGKLNAR